MGYTSSGIPDTPWDGKEEDPEDSRYTQHSGWGDRARSHEELKSDQIRKPSLGEGLAFREKI